MKKLVPFLQLILLLSGCSSVQSISDSPQKVVPVENKDTLNVQVVSPQLRVNDLVKKEVKEFLDGELNKVVVAKGKEDPSPIEIADPYILRSLPWILNMNHMLEIEPFPGGLRIDETPCIYKVYSGDKHLSFEILADGIVLYQKDGKSFYFQSGYDTYLLGKAFIQKPNDIPDEPVLAKMYDSGLLMSYSNGQSDIAYISTFRVQGSVRTFVSMNKQKIHKPEGELNFRNRLTYYYFGDKIELNIYDKYIQIVDNKNEYWYSAAETDIHSIFSFLSAG